MRSTISGGEVGRRSAVPLWHGGWTDAPRYGDSGRVQSAKRGVVRWLTKYDVPRTMDRTQPVNSNRKVHEMQRTSSVDLTNDTEAGQVVQLKNHRQAQLEFGLNWYQIATAVKRGELRRVQLAGKGRIYYLEDELQALAAAVTGKCSLTFAGAA